MTQCFLLQFHYLTRFLTQDVIPFLNNVIFQYTNPLSFETEPHNIHTIPFSREHRDSYLYYFWYQTIERIHSQNLLPPVIRRRRKFIQNMLSEKQNLNS